MRLVHDSERYSKSEILQISHFLRERDNFGEEVDFELENVSAARTRTNALDGENSSRHANIALLNFASPVVEYLLGRQLQSKTVAVRLQLLSFDVIFPAFSCSILQLHICIQYNNNRTQSIFLSIFFMS